MKQLFCFLEKDKKTFNYITDYINIIKERKIASSPGRNYPERGNRGTSQEK